MVKLTAVMALAAALFGCYEDPKLKSCAEFPIGTAESCGSGCDIYCATIMENCSDQFTSAGACKANCLETLSSSGSFGDVRGDTLQCRITHAQRAASDATACEAASACVTDATCQAGRGKRASIEGK